MPPPADDRSEFLERHRPYVEVLARFKVPPWLHNWFSHSDAAQQTMLQVLGRQDELREKDEPQVRAYLRTVLENVIRDAIRKNKRIGNGVIEELINQSTRIDPGPADSATPSRAVMQEEIFAEMAAGLYKLPERQRLAIELRYLRTPEHSIADIAEELKCTEKAAAALLCRGLEQMRMIMKRSE